jgi:hypothetical protein
MTLNLLSKVNVVSKTVLLERPGLIEKRAKKLMTSPPAPIGGELQFQIK